MLVSEFEKLTRLVGMSQGEQGGSGEKLKKVELDYQGLHWYGSGKKERKTSHKGHGEKGLSQNVKTWDPTKGWGRGEKKKREEMHKGELYGGKHRNWTGSRRERGETGRGEG